MMRIPFKSLASLVGIVVGLEGCESLNSVFDDSNPHYVYNPPKVYMHQPYVNAPVHPMPYAVVPGQAAPAQGHYQSQVKVQEPTQTHTNADNFGQPNSSGMQNTTIVPAAAAAPIPPPAVGE